MKGLAINLMILILSIGANAESILNVRDFGAKGDGTTDDTKAIQSAINNASPILMTTIYFPKGIYNIASYTTTTNFLENYCLKLHSNLSIKGDGDGSIIRLADHTFDKKDTAANGHIFYGKVVQNVNFSDLLIDMNGSNNLVPLNVFKNYSAIFTSVGENYHINNITVKNCSGTNMIDIMSDGDNLLIENCRFINGGNYVGNSKPNNGQIDFSFVYSEWTNTIIRNNFIQQQNIEIALENYTGGIELHGSGSSAVNNYVEGCWPGIYITSIKGPLENITVQNNKFLKCVTGIFFYVNHTIRNVLIENNDISLTPARSPKNDFCAGIRIPNGNLKEYSKELANLAPLYNVKIIGNTISADSMQTLSMGMILHSLHQSVVSGNEIKQMNYSGIVLQGSKWGTDSLLVENNVFTDFRPNNNPTAVGGYVVITDTYSPGIKDAPGFKNVLFSKNKFKGNFENRKTKNPPKRSFFGAFVALPSSMKNDIKFENNYFSDKNENVHLVAVP